MLLNRELPSSKGIYSKQEICDFKRALAVI